MPQPGVRLDMWGMWVEASAKQNWEGCARKVFGRYLSWKVTCAAKNHQNEKMLGRHSQTFTIESVKGIERMRI